MYSGTWETFTTYVIGITVTSCPCQDSAVWFIQDCSIIPGIQVQLSQQSLLRSRLYRGTSTFPDPSGYFPPRVLESPFVVTFLSPVFPDIKGAHALVLPPLQILGRDDDARSKDRHCHVTAVMREEELEVALKQVCSACVTVIGNGACLTTAAAVACLLHSTYYFNLLLTRVAERRTRLQRPSLAQIPTDKFYPVAVTRENNPHMKVSTHSECPGNTPHQQVTGLHKVVIVGNGAVGKSSMIQRYCKGTFTKDYKKTIGVDFLERQIDEEGNEKPPHFLKLPSMCAFYQMVRTALASRRAEYMSSLDGWETRVSYS
uniref:Uncharacterized protein n=1 Tax=Timema tahoe TaxID=61484 RepID=A0A7R9ILR9_9NEOP|nr:unnamed protein product [Timema tahoe]